MNLYFTQLKVYFLRNWKWHPRMASWLPFSLHFWRLELTSVSCYIVQWPTVRVQMAIYSAILLLLQRLLFAKSNENNKHWQNIIIQKFVTFTNSKLISCGNCLKISFLSKASSHSLLNGNSWQTSCLSSSLTRLLCVGTFSKSGPGMTTKSLWTITFLGRPGTPAFPAFDLATLPFLAELLLLWRLTRLAMVGKHDWIRDCIEFCGTCPLCWDNCVLVLCSLWFSVNRGDTLLANPGCRWLKACNAFAAAKQAEFRSAILVRPSIKKAGKSQNAPEF